jgi:hypothetical protein
MPRRALVTMGAMAVVALGTDPTVVPITLFAVERAEFAVALLSQLPSVAT